jgi:hypothetical protein
VENTELKTGRFGTDFFINCVIPHETASFFCENHEERRRGRKKDLRKKKAFAFFYIKILSSFFPLFSLRTSKVSRSSPHFYVGIAAETP